MRRSPLVWILALASIACEAPTEIVLVVQQREGAVFDVLTLEIAVDGARLAEPIAQIAEPTFPLTLGMRPASGAERARVTVTADGLPPATAELEFVEGRRQLLYVELDDACVGCGAGEACFRGSCEGQVRGAPCAFVDSVASGERHASVAESCVFGASVDGGLDAGPPLDAGPVLPGWSSIAMAPHHVCAVFEGAVYCAGRNERGQLGDASRTPSSQMVAVQGLPNDDVAVQVGVGLRHSCARLASGRVACWGDNRVGQLGRDTGASVWSASADLVLDEASAPVRADALAVGGRFGCIVANQTIRCWGSNSSGQLAQPSEVGRSLAPLSVAENMTDVTAGMQHACGLSVGGGVLCWGNPGSGRLGQLTEDGRIPITVPIPFDEVHSIRAGDDHTCAVVTAEAAAVEVWCWGVNEHGQAAPDADSVSAPAPVNGLMNPSASMQLAVGATHSCVLISGTLQCWGDNRFEALLADSAGATRLPVTARADAQTWRSAASGANALCAIDDVGAMSCWGYNPTGLLGVEDAPLARPSFVRQSTEVTAVTLGSRHGCSIANSTLSCWGESTQHQRGDGTLLPANAAPTMAGVVSPVQDEVGGDPLTRIVAGARHTCGTNDGLADLRCWGDNEFSQADALLSGSSAIATPAPVLPAGLQAFDLLAAGAQHTCAAVSDGEFLTLCWGGDAHGQRGDGDGTHRLPLYGAMAAGPRHTCALTTDDAPADRDVHCWGDNQARQVDPTTQLANSPTEVVVAAGDMPWEYVAAGDDFSCAATLDQVVCWGDSSAAQLGDNVGPAPERVQVDVDGRIEGLVAAGQQACVWTDRADAEVQCWGANDAGQLGAPFAERLAPTTAAFPESAGVVSAVAMGPRTTCVIAEETTGEPSLFCAGSDEYWLRGEGARPIAYVEPQRVPEPSP